jgi:hypothetical protein
MAKTYKLSESEIPARRATSQYADIVADFMAQGTESMKVTIEGVKPATLRAGLRRAPKGKVGEGVRLAQRGEETYLVREATR